MKKLYITFCLLLVSLCIHAQMISGIIVDEKTAARVCQYSVVSYLALVQIWEQYNYIQMRNYYTLVHIMLSCEVM